MTAFDTDCPNGDLERTTAPAKSIWKERSLGACVKKAGGNLGACSRRKHNLGEVRCCRRRGVTSMRLTKFSDYALRVLMYTQRAGGRRVTIEEMAAAYRISRAHLMKVVNSLVRAGYLTAHRGRSGGLGLGRPAEDIRLGEV